MDVLSKKQEIKDYIERLFEDINNKDRGYFVEASDSVIYLPKPVGAVYNNKVDYRMQTGSFLVADIEAFYMNDNGEKTTIRYHRSVSDFKDNPHLGDIVKSKDGNCSIYIKGGNIHGQLYCDEIYLGELDGMSTEREMDHYGIL